jgi:hypothetical protein
MPLLNGLAPFIVLLDPLNNRIQIGSIFQVFSWEYFTLPTNLLLTGHSVLFWVDTDFQYCYSVYNFWQC